MLINRNITNPKVQQNELSIGGVQLSITTGYELAKLILLNSTMVQTLSPRQDERPDVRPDVFSHGSNIKHPTKISSEIPIQAQRLQSRQQLPSQPSDTTSFF
ncbi:MAG: hypothetical protein ACI9VM_000795 [Candidatus Azotimanducaceae bacterium]|jgi:hypothetical protein